ncbi:hypothetical protein BH23BAC4_BH23BAC4_03880 [soil metagenome]
MQDRECCHGSPLLKQGCLFYVRHEAAGDLIRDKIARARIALRNDPGAQRMIRLDESRERRQSEWIQQAKHFYGNALDTPHIAAALAGIGISETDLQEGLARANNFEELFQVRTREAGEAQRTTYMRNEVLGILDQWMRDFRGIARLDLAHKPQLI